MNITGRRIIQRVLAIVIILTMTMADFCLVGANVVSYAESQINNQNVNFDVSFENGTVETTTTIDSKDLKIGINLSVKSDGYLEDGKILLEDANFKFSKSISNEYIKKVEDNVIELKQINEGEIIQIEAGLEFVPLEEMNSEYLNKVSTIKLTGNYVNSKNVNKEKIEIVGTANVKVNWKAPDEIKSELEVNLLTNSIYSMDELEKRVIQATISSYIVNNSYPVKSTNIELEIPNSPESVTVYKRSTAATNGNRDFSYDYQDGKLTISIQNGEDNKIAWVKNAKDIFVVTAEYDKETEIIGARGKATSRIVTCDNKELIIDDEEDKHYLRIEKEMDNLVNISETEMQTNMAKGKIYSGEEKTYFVNTSLIINYSKPINEMKIEEKETRFMIAEEEKEANIEYVQTSIDRNKLIQLFGEEVVINVYSGGRELLATIDGNTEADKIGNIIIPYKKGVKSLSFETTKPKAEGILNIINEKRILKTEYSREEIKELTKIKDASSVTYTKLEGETTNKASNTITLKETVSKASFNVEPITLTTSQKQEIKMEVVLESDSEEKDLFKNPELKITLPKEIESFESATCKLLYGNGLEIESAKISKEEKSITIKLNGEQKAYDGEAIKGATVLINAIVGLDRLIPNREGKMVLNYTNENATKYLDDGKEEIKVKMVSENAMILTNDIEEYNISTIGNQGKKKVDLDTNTQEKTATVNMKIINNESADIKDVKITGTIANIDGKVEKTGDITSNLKNANIESNIDKYTVTVDEIKEGKEIDLSYNLRIAKNLSYNLVTDSGYEVTYTNSETGQTKTAKSTTLLLTTGEQAEIAADLKATVGGKEIKDGEEVKAGEIIEYVATVSNTGREDAENVKIGLSIPAEGKIIEITKESSEEGEEVMGSMYYFTEKENQEKTVTLKAGKTEIYKYMVKIDPELSENKQAETTLSVKYQDKVVTTKSIKNELVKGSLSLVLTPTGRSGKTSITTGYNYRYNLEVSNLTNNEQRNVSITINKNDLIDITGMTYTLGDKIKEFSGENLTFAIDSISAKGKVNVRIDAIAKAVKDNETTADVSITARDSSNKTYRSNQISEIVVGAKIEVELTSTTSSNKETGYIKAGDEVKYTIKLKNVGKTDTKNLSIKDRFSDYLDLKSIKINGNDCKYTEALEFGKDNNYNTLVINSSLKAGEEAILEITAKVNKGMQSTETLKVINKVLVYDTVLLAETDEKVYYIEALSSTNASEIQKGVDVNTNNQNNNSNNSNNNNNNNNNNNTNNNNNGNINNNSNNSNNSNNQSGSKSYSVSGTVWEDKDQSGSRDLEETKIEGIKVYAINVETNKVVTDSEGKEIFTTTNNEGFYTLTLPKGEYIIVFEYDTSKYIVTKYQAEGVSSDINSDATKSEKVAVTDAIKLTESVANIDLGLLEAKVFKLELQKVISKMVVTNKSGSKTYDFDDTNIAKVDIAGKDLSTANVVIEYKIKVTNKGEIAGYAKNIVDYVPSSLTFNSSLNSDWYKKGNNLYTSALADTKIEPGETKEVKLILTKKMTESNTGLTNNKAEIEEVYNNLGLDNASTGSSTTENEQENKGSADAIITVKTGSVASYSALGLTIIVIICGTAYLINKKLLLEKIKI